VFDLVIHRLASNDGCATSIRPPSMSLPEFLEGGWAAIPFVIGRDSPAD
jgi:hypothetical protein